MTMQPFNSNISHHPFGMVMPERSYASGDGYRFGFNGMEKDDEVKGDGNSLDFNARIYDSRLGKWMSTDPKAKLQPQWSPYKSYLDNPIVFTDETGETERIFTYTYNKKTKTTKLEVTYASKLMTNGAKVWAYRSLSSDTYLANPYFDFTTIKFVIEDGKNKEVVSSKSTIDNVKNPITYEGIFFGGDKYGDTKIDWSFRASGGMTLYSSDGQSQESKIASEGAEMVDIGPILDALGAYAGGGDLQKKIDKMVRRINLSKDAGALIDAASIIGQVMQFYGDAFDRAHTLKDNIDKARNNTSSNPSQSDSMSCQYCTETIDEKSFKDSDGRKHLTQKVKEDNDK